MLFGRIIETVKQLIQAELGSISVAVDATMGNGNDTLFLSDFVGDQGKVYAFDVQESAIEATKKRLDEEGVVNVALIHDGHEHMADYVDEPVDLIMFNLGYLPKGDHKIITAPESTCQAIDVGLRIMKVGGLLTVISYYGHPGGQTEKSAVKRLLTSLDPDNYDVMEMNAINKRKCPPIIYVVRKKNIV